MSPEQKRTLDRFYTAATDQDATALRSLLTDDFSFTSTMMSFDNPDDYVAHLAGFCGSISDSRYVAQGNRVVHMSVLHARFPDRNAEIPLCDVFTFEGNKIAHQELYTDSALFPRPA